jgi:nucleoside-diphosphate-sugar epimerase
MKSLLVSYLSRRAKQRFALASIGPNEARIVFDLAASGGAALEAHFYAAIVLRKAVLVDWRLEILAMAFVGVNAVLGMYSRLRRSRIRTKVATLVASIVVVSVIGLATGIDTAAVALWVMFVSAPVLSARVLLGLPHSKHKNLERLAINRRGPVLVIGGAGYIGSHTVDLLLQRGHRVRVLDKLMYGRASLQEFMGSPHFELVEGDVTDITKLTAALKGASTVVHLAGLVGDPACAVDTDFTRHTNIVATRMAKDVAQSLGVYRFIFASSCSVYGRSEKEISELEELHPLSVYAETKIDSERELLGAVCDDFFVTVLRFATVFGHSPRPRFDLVANFFTAQALTDGLITVTGPRQRRPFVHVRDVARAIVLTLEADPVLVQGEIYNVGDRRLNLTILQLAEMVKSIAGEFREVRISVKEDTGDVRSYAVSFDKISGRLGFEATILMEFGIREMVDHFLSGRYTHYRDALYSNLATTKTAVEQFHDPQSTSRLYGPLKVQ